MREKMKGEKKNEVILSVRGRLGSLKCYVISVGIVLIAWPVQVKCEVKCVLSPTSISDDIPQAINAENRTVRHYMRCSCC
jgi:hypothetical protein